MSDVIITEKALEQLILEDSNFTLLERRLSDFCPFEALGMVNAEIRHSNFLGSMLDPYRPHGFGSFFLRQVLDDIFREADERIPLSRFKLYLADLDTADIRREWNRIDLLIILPEIRLVIALELKIGTEEHSDQLSRYADIIESQWPLNGEKRWSHLMLMLSRGGDEPSDPRWGLVTYEVIISSIKTVLEREGRGNPLARNMLLAYAMMLERHHMEDPKLENLAQSLWSRHKEALEYLMARRPDASLELSKQMQARVKNMAEAASFEGLSLETIRTSNTYFQFGVKEWDSIPGMLSGTGRPHTNRIIIIEIENWQCKVTVRLVMGQGPKEVRERIFKLLQPAMTKGAERLTNKWKSFDSAVLSTKPKSEEDFDVENAMKKIESGFAKFIKSRISEFHKILIPAH